MRAIDKVAAKYRARGHGVRVLSSKCIQVTDRWAGNVYQVDLWGQVYTAAQVKREQVAAQQRKGA